MSIRSLFQDIADAIKIKDTSIVTLSPAEMPDAIRNIPSGSGVSENLFLYMQDYKTVKATLYQKIGYEYTGYIYSNQTMIDSLDLVLLYDASQGGATDITLLDSINNYTAIILQGVYRESRTSQYNTSMLYYPPELSNYWAGMKDRNQSYTCTVEFTDDTHATLSGNKEVIIYGLL